MPHYDFEDEQGEQHELWYSMADAPRVGEVIEHGGKKLTRVWSHPRAVVRRDIEFKGWSLDPWTPGFDRYDTDGQPLISGRRELQRGIDGARRAGIDLAYGDGWSGTD
jgi:hypothetical protein